MQAASSASIVRIGEGTEQGTETQTSPLRAGLHTHLYKSCVPPFLRKKRDLFKRKHARAFIQVRVQAQVVSSKVHV